MSQKIGPKELQRRAMREAAAEGIRPKRRRTIAQVRKIITKPKGKSS